MLFHVQVTLQRMLLLSLIAGLTQTAAVAYQPPPQTPPQPLTAADPEIEEQALKLLVNPLTQEELVVVRLSAG
jgi:hypothetical protein